MNCSTCTKFAHDSEQNFISKQKLYEIRENSPLNVPKKCEVCLNWKTESNYICDNNHFICEACSWNLDSEQIYYVKECPSCYSINEMVKEMNQANNSYESIEVITQNVASKRKLFCCRNCTRYSFHQISSVKCTKGYFYCDSCIQEGFDPSQIIQLCMCDYCFNLKKRMQKSDFKVSYNGPVIINQSISNSPLKSEVNFNTRCAICPSGSNIGLLCNHNLCSKCLLNSIIYEFKDFIALIKNNNFEGIPEKFILKCPVPECKRVMRIPYLILSKILELPLSASEMELIKPFLPYFDGIKCKFSKCRCGFTVMMVHKRKINCKCRL